MKLFTKKKTNLELEIDGVIETMTSIAPYSEEYNVAMNNLERLYKLKNERKVKSDTVMIVAGNLLGILLILGYERANIITTKALGFVMKGRV